MEKEIASHSELISELRNERQPIRTTPVAAAADRSNLLERAQNKILDKPDGGKKTMGAASAEALQAKRLELQQQRADRLRTSHVRAA